MIYLPVLMGLAGTMILVAGALIIASRRRRSFVTLGVLLAMTGVSVAAPTLVSETARTAVASTTTAFSHLTGGAPPAQAELVATDTTP